MLNTLRSLWYAHFHKERTHSELVSNFLRYYLVGNQTFSCIALRDFKCSDADREWLNSKIKEESDKQWDAFYAEHADARRRRLISSTVSPFRALEYRDYEYVERIARIAFLTELYYTERMRELPDDC